MRHLILGMALEGLLAAQVQPPQPKVSIPFQCVAEELEAAGLSCTPRHPCVVYLELVSLEPVGGKLMLSGNIHTPEATLTSILLSSDDGGRSWIEPYGRLRGAGLEQIQFLDYETGWVGGQTLQGRVRDPFLLLTRDGGKSWQIRPVFDESHSGLIEKFHFESRTRGSLLVDRMQSSETGARHELYETQTGGDSWSLMQVSDKPLQLRRTPVGEGNTDWRLRADGPSKSYRVEQRQGDKWHVVATIPIHLADCTSTEPPPLAEPPPDPGEVKIEAEKAGAPAAPKKAPTLKKK